MSASGPTGRDRRRLLWGASAALVVAAAVLVVAGEGADRSAHAALPPGQTGMVLAQAAHELEAAVATAPSVARAADLQAGAARVRQRIADFDGQNVPEGALVALRTVAALGVHGPAGQRSAEILAEVGGDARATFRWMAVSALVLATALGVLGWRAPRRSVAASAGAPGSAGEGRLGEPSVETAPA